MEQRLMTEFENQIGKTAFKDSRFNPAYVEWLEKIILKQRKLDGKEQIINADKAYEELLEKL